MKIPPLPKIFPYRPGILFTDVDETLTWKGRLPQEAFIAMDRLQKSGIKVIPVTGASAGWCDCLIRTWPIDSIIGENGAFHIDRDDKGRLSYTYALERLQRLENWQHLQQLKEDVLSSFSDAHETTDQAFRLTDIAFDIRQDRQVDRQHAAEIAKYCRDSGMNAKLSSLHINVWCGEYDKASTSNNWLALHEIERSEAMFCGDSPNDDSMFSNFTQTVGVANVQPFIEELESPPSYITRQPGGYGFAEMTESILKRYEV